MTTDELWLKELSSAQRARFFAELSHGLTIAMRVIGVDDLEALRERVRAVNEVHHIVSGYLLSIHLDQEDTRWIKQVFRAISAASDPLVSEQLNLAWHYAKQAAR